MSLFSNKTELHSEGFNRLLSTVARIEQGCFRFSQITIYEERSHVWKGLKQANALNARLYVEYYEKEEDFITAKRLHVFNLAKTWVVASRLYPNENSAFIANRIISRMSAPGDWMKIGLSNALRIVPSEAGRESELALYNKIMANDRNRWVKRFEHNEDVKAWVKERLVELKPYAVFFSNTGIQYSTRSGQTIPSLLVSFNETGYENMDERGQLEALATIFCEATDMAYRQIQTSPFPGDGVSSSGIGLIRIEDEIQLREW